MHYLAVGSKNGVAVLASGMYFGWMRLVTALFLKMLMLYYKQRYLIMTIPNSTADFYRHPKPTHFAIGIYGTKYTKYSTAVLHAQHTATKQWLSM